MADDRPQLPLPEGQPRLHWKRFAVLASGVVTFGAAVRLVADAAGVQRGTVASAGVSAFSMFWVMLAIGLFAPRAMNDTRPIFTRRRLLVGIVFSAVYAAFNFWFLKSTL
ncbi:MAG: hypothetical protein V4813_15510 [Gemmatimonadota bacterium]